MSPSRVTFTVPQAVFDKIVELSQATDMSISGVANRAVREWIEENYKEILAFYAKEKPKPQENWK